MKLWQDQQNAQELISFLLSKLEPNGWLVTWHTQIAFSELRMASLKKDLHDQQIKYILKEMKERGETTVEIFEEVYFALFKKRKNQRTETNKYSFLFPVQLVFEPDLIGRKEVYFEGHKFTFLSRSTVNRKLDKENRALLSQRELIEFHTEMKIEHSFETFISVSIMSEDYSSAVTQIEPAFSALRGMMELLFNLQVPKWSTAGRFSRRTLQHPVFAIVLENESVLTWVFANVDDLKTADPITLGKKSFESIKKNASFFRTKPNDNSTDSLILDCFRLYAQAQDSRNRGFCFLGFWQVAEAATLAWRAGGSTESVTKILAWHGQRHQLIGSGFRFTLKELANKRNQLVHNGVNNLTDDDINILKLAVEFAIDWLIEVRKELSTINHLEEFFRIKDLGNSKTKAIQEALDFNRQL